MPSHKPIYNLVFSGAGVRGMAFIGALEMAEQLKIIDLKTIKRTAGCSAGAIVAGSLAIGFSVDEALQGLQEMPLQSFAEPGWPGQATFNLIKNWGMYSTKNVRSWIEELVSRKIPAEFGGINVTFRQLRELRKLNKELFKDLYISAINVSRRNSQIFCYELTPDVKVVDAVVASLAIPFFFEPTKVLNGDDEHPCYYIDGGFGDAWAPYDIFDSSGLFFKDKEAYKRQREEESSLYDVEIMNSSLTSVKSSLISISKEDLNSESSDEEEPEGVLSVNPHTLIFMVLEMAELEHMRRGKRMPVVQLSSFSTFLQQVIETSLLMGRKEGSWSHEKNKTRIVFIDDANISPTDFSLDETKKNLLYRTGKRCVSEHFFKNIDYYLKHEKLYIDKVIDEKNESYRQNLLLFSKIDNADELKSELSPSGRERKKIDSKMYLKLAVFNSAKKYKNLTVDEASSFFLR